jgi:AcrR family transcriptional regulator
MDTSIRTHLLTCSRRLFLQFGYSKVTMDEIAREMAMSKKTIYVYFPSKVKLIEDVIAEMRDEIVQGVKRIMEQESASQIEKLRQIFIFTAERFSQISPFVVADLERNVPELWDLMKKVKYDLAFKNIKALMQEGIAKGSLRPNLNIDMLLMFYAASFQHVQDNSFQKDFPREIREKLPTTADKVFEEWVNICFDGIVKL